MADDAPAPTPEPTDAPQRRPLSLLAQERYGHNYHGEVAEDADTPAPEPQPEPTPDPEPEPDDGDAPETEPGDDDDAAEADADAGEQDDDDGEPISSLHELIEAQEWDPEWFNALKVPVKVDGQPAEATVADLVKSYQMGEAAEKRLTEAKDKAKSIIEDAAGQQQDLQRQFGIANKLIEKAEKALDSEVADIDWQQLREDDPAEYSAKKTEIAERREELERAKTQAANEWTEATKQQEQQFNEDLRKYRDEQEQHLLQKLPEWSDPEKAKAEKSAIVDILVNTYGFTPDEVKNTYDHRLIVLARDAMQHRKSQPKNSAAKKKVAKVPKVMKPGAPKPREQANQERIQALKARLKQTGKMEDALALRRAMRGANQ